MTKIFQIGFNRCGTNSIAKVFNRYSNLRCVHWEKGFLAKKIFDNIVSSNSPLFGYEEFNVFCDMECFFFTDKLNYYPAFYEYKIFDKFYKNSKFILNTRNKEKWIASRLNHKINVSPIKNNTVEELENKYYWEMHQNVSGKSKEEIIQDWSEQWDYHHNRVLEYFKNRKQDLLIYNIEEDSYDKFVDFFRNCGILIKNNRFPVENRSK